MTTFSLVDSTKKSKVKVDWLTPPRLVYLLGPFDLDPCASVNQPWPTAKRMIVLPEDGLKEKWEGYTFCNPPYGAAIRKFVKKMAEHGDGILLVPAATEVKWFQPIWQKASAIFFVHDRMMFYHPHSAGPFKSGTLCLNKWRPSVLAGFGRKALEALHNLMIAGSLVETWKNHPALENIYV